MTNGFSKKIENHIHAVALFYMHYNFGRIHQSLRVTPAMEAGVSQCPGSAENDPTEAGHQHVWSIQEIIALTSPVIAQAA